MVFVCLGFYFGINFDICPAVCPEIYLVGKNIRKIMVSLNLHQADLLEVVLPKIPGDHETLFIVRHVGLHVNFLSISLL